MAAATFYSPAPNNTARSLENSEHSPLTEGAFGSAAFKPEAQNGPTCEIGGKLYQAAIPIPGVQAITVGGIAGGYGYNVTLHYADGAASNFRVENFNGLLKEIPSQRNILSNAA